MSILQSEEEIVAVFGEDERDTVHRALLWLDINEPPWSFRVDRLAYVAEILERRRRRIEAQAYGC